MAALWFVKFAFSYTTVPFKMVCVTRDLNVEPSKGDHPHLYRQLSLVTVQGLFGFKRTKSAI